MYNIEPHLIARSGKTLEELEELHEIFALVDSDGSGQISRQELEELMRMVGSEIYDSEITQMLVESGGEGNEEIDFECIILPRLIVAFVLAVTKKFNSSISLKDMTKAFKVLETYENFKGFITSKLTREMAQFQ